MDFVWGQYFIFWGRGKKFVSLDWFFVSMNEEAISACGWEKKLGSQIVLSFFLSFLRFSCQINRFFFIVETWYWRLRHILVLILVSTQKSWTILDFSQGKGVSWNHPKPRNFLTFDREKKSLCLFIARDKKGGKSDRGSLHIIQHLRVWALSQNSSLF